MAHLTLRRALGTLTQGNVWSGFAGGDPLRPVLAPAAPWTSETPSMQIRPAIPFVVSLGSCRRRRPMRPQLAGTAQGPRTGPRAVPAERPRARFARIACALLVAAVSPVAAQDNPDSFHAITDTGTIVDPFHRSETTSEAIEQGAPIPTATIVAYCGDADGCQLLIMSSTDPTSGGVSIRSRRLVTTPNGNRWRLYDSAWALIEQGSLSNDPLENIAVGSVGSYSTCVFREHEDVLGFVRYYFLINFGPLDLGREMTCRLTIAD